MTRSLLLAVTTVLAASSARADVLTVTRYDMPNGAGQASGGSFNYWDLGYSGAGSKTTDGAPLSGGAGDLTDGVVAGDFWFNVENVAGTGPYVGWRDIAPVITFYLAGAASFDTVRVHVDDSGVGGVSAPRSITVDDGQGHSQTFTTGAINQGNVRWLDLDVSSLGLTGDVIQLTLNPSDVWVFSDEVRFLGVSSVPEPSVPVLAGLTVALFGVARVVRKRRPTGPA